MTPILEIRNLAVQFPGPSGLSRPVDGLDLTLQRGEFAALVGESGCGKSLTTLSVMRLLPHPGQTSPGSQVLFDGTNLLDLDPEAMRRIRGRRIGMVFQDPMTSLNPVFTIGQQLRETLSLHHPGSADSVRQAALRLIGEVGLPEPTAALDAFPHQLSGGMRQRALIALALAGEPELLIADEPTTALDVTVQAQILELLDRLRASRGMTVLFITHDLGLVAGRADQIAVMYAGRIVEEGLTAPLFARPGHPYTRGLFNALPRLDRPVARLAPIAGIVPDPRSWPTGCRFHPRCPERLARCSAEEPPEMMIGMQHRSSCWLHAADGAPDA